MNSGEGQTLRFVATYGDLRVYLKMVKITMLNSVSDVS